MTDERVADATESGEREIAARVRLLGLRNNPISVEEVLSAVADPAAGGQAVFVGTVRDHDGGRDVAALSYSAHPSASRVLWEVAENVAASADLIAVAAVHRVGDLDVGDIAVVVAVSAAHRGEALDACHRLIDDLKGTVPIWKHQRFADGTTEWVGVDLEAAEPGGAPTLVP